jgi:hypothetical protein
VTLIKAFGFTLERTRGSHQVFTHPKVQEVLNIQPDKSGQAKGYQIDQFLAFIKEHNLTLEED